jgi:hypothetical protein
MKAENLVTFFDLLREGYTVAQLATTVEQHGVTGWDRYGRYGTFKPSDDATKSALDALAKYLQSEEDYWNKKSQEQPPDLSEFISEDPFIDIFEDWFSLPIHRFGWQRDNLPPMDRKIEPLAPKRRKKEYEFSQKTLLNIIGCFLSYIAERSESGKPIYSPSEAQLAERFLADDRRLYGTSERNLDKVFEAAKRQLRTS